MLIQLKACGICGSDVHMAQADDDGHIWYPGLTGFPCTLGHELSGIVVEAGPAAYEKKPIGIAEVPENIVALRTDPNECKINCLL